MRETLVNYNHIANDDIREAIMELNDRIAKLEAAKAEPKPAASRPAVVKNAGGV